MSNEVIFFPNGNIVVSKEKTIINSLNSSFIILFCEWLEKNNELPETFEITMPDGKKVKPFRTGLGEWNWSIK